MNDLSHCPDPEGLRDLGELPARLVREGRPVYGEPARLEELRQAAETGLPVEAVRALQLELKRFGLRRPSAFVNRIVPRATRQRRERLKQEESEAVLRVAAVMALAVYVWGEEGGGGGVSDPPSLDAEGCDTPGDGPVGSWGEVCGGHSLGPALRLARLNLYRIHDPRHDALSGTGAALKGWAMEPTRAARRLYLVCLRRHNARNPRPCWHQADASRTCRLPDCSAGRLQGGASRRGAVPGLVRLGAFPADRARVGGLAAVACPGGTFLRCAALGPERAR